MRRADRLFQIVQHLRARRLTTAAQLAEWLSVSERTIYRDIRDLSLTGVPVEGEAGVGYRLGKDFDVPPIMFTLDEVEALATGARMVESWGGPVLAASARSALAKITLALPASRRGDVEQTRLFAPKFHLDAGLKAQVGLQLETIRQAILKKQKIDVQYLDAKERESQRRIWPMGLYFWGATWTVIGWCETRKDFRNFRVDRMSTVDLTEEAFREEEGRSLADFLAKVRAYPR
jgi:predicted DNA-binding transcriptional regulator YafY